MLRGVKLGKFHTGNDWGLILNSKNIETPKAKITKIDVEGRDGDIDLSEVLTGSIKYENRKASFTFLLTDGTYIDRERLINTILNEVHGKKLNIILDDDVLHYLTGRCIITKSDNDKAYGVIEIESDCEPWRYSVIESTRTVEVSADVKEVALVNRGSKTVIPALTVEGNVTLEYNNQSVSLSTGEYKVASLALKTGTTLIKLNGSGTIVFTYREGVL